MVVFIHIVFNGNFGIIINALARFAVPLFFLISGFFSYKISTEKIKKRIKHIIFLTIISSAIYSLFNAVKLFCNGNLDSVILYFRSYLKPENLFKLFVFNVPISSSHIWYLLAMLYVYLLFFLVTKFKLNEKIIFIISFLFLILHLLLGECLSAFGTILPNYYVRNFALMGIPFFSLGLFTKKYENKLHNIPNPLLILSVLIGIIETVLSRLIFGINELYIGSLFILFTFVAIFIKYSNIEYPRFFNTLTGCSTYIYIFHIIVARIITKLYEIFNIDLNSIVFLKNLHPLIVCFVTTVLTYLIIQITNKISLIKNKKTLD